MPENASLPCDDPALWRAAPVEALANWLEAPDFIQVRSGERRPLRASSVRVYQAMGTKFIREVLREGKDWTSITATDIDGFLLTHELNGGVRHRYVRMLERLFDHLKPLGLADGNPARGLAVRSPTHSNQGQDQTQWLSGDHQAALVGALPAGQSWKHQRNRALIATVLGGGLKLSEILRLRADAVGLPLMDDSVYLEVRPGGGGRTHRTKVAAFAARILWAWVEARATFGVQGALLFPAKLTGGTLHPATVYRQVAKVLQAAGIDPREIKRRGARTLRNTFAMRELAAGGPPERVGEYLGHRAERSTRYYTALLKK